MGGYDKMDRTIIMWYWMEYRDNITLPKDRVEFHIHSVSSLITVPAIHWTSSPYQEIGILTFQPLSYEPN